MEWKQQWDNRKRTSGEQPLPFSGSFESPSGFKPDSGYFHYLRLSSLQQGQGASNLRPSPALASRSYYYFLFPDNNALLILLLLFQHDQLSSLPVPGSKQNYRQSFPLLCAGRLQEQSLCLSVCKQQEGSFLDLQVNAELG